MRNNFPLCGALSLALACAAFGQTPQPAPKLTEEELLKQIESLSPATGDPRRKAPASFAAPKAGNPVARIDTVAAAAGAVLPGAAADKTAKPEKKPKGATEIVALEATFDQKAHQAVFIGDVVVTDPEFNVLCDKLTAYLRHDDDKPVGNAATPKMATPKPATPAPTAAPGEKKKSGGLERAIAEASPGAIVTVHQDKKEADGTISKSVGHGRRATYTTKAGENFKVPGRTYSTREGDIVLEGKPDVQQGVNRCVATADETVMILNRDGEMRVIGPHTTEIRDQGDVTK